ncbi:DUF1648 domain-containing protein, partial [Rhodococcus sp. NPDC058514]
ATVPIAMLAPQRGLADASTASLDGWWLLLVAGIGLVGAAIAFALLPAPGPSVAQAAPPADAPRIPLGDSERVVWSGSAAMPWWIAVAVALAPIVITVVIISASSSSAVMVLGVIVSTVVGGALMALALSPVRVVVDDRGVQTRSPLTGTRRRIPLVEVAEADVVKIGLLNRFGGFGYRVGPGGVGLIVRPGPALRVTRGDGSRFTVTVDGAEQAAAVLNALAARERARR